MRLDGDSGDVTGGARELGAAGAADGGALGAASARQVCTQPHRHSAGTEPGCTAAAPRMPAAKRRGQNRHWCGYTTEQKIVEPQKH